MPELHGEHFRANNLIDDVVGPQPRQRPQRRLGITDYMPFEEFGRRLKKNKFIASLRQPRSIEVENADQPTRIPVHKPVKKVNFTRVPPLSSPGMQVTPDGLSRVSTLELVSEMLAAVSLFFATQFQKTRDFLGRNFEDRQTVSAAPIVAAGAISAVPHNLLSRKTYTLNQGAQHRRLAPLYGLATVLAILAVIFLVASLLFKQPANHGGHSAGGTNHGSSSSATATSAAQKNTSAKGSANASSGSSASGPGGGATGSSQTAAGSGGATGSAGSGGSTGGYGGGSGGTYSASQPAAAPVGGYGGGTTSSGGGTTSSGSSSGPSTSGELNVSGTCITSVCTPNVSAGVDPSLPSTQSLTSPTPSLP